jgi:hypothetical protein
MSEVQYPFFFIFRNQLKTELKIEAFRSGVLRQSRTYGIVKSTDHALWRGNPDEFGVNEKRVCHPNHSNVRLNLT